VLAGICGLAFGAADQYLGSRIELGIWASSVSGLSAPWLVLPFLAGWTQARRSAAMAAGLIAVLAALAGYFTMTVSPVEGVPVARFATAFAALARSNVLWVVGGLLTAPIYGLLGRRWRLERWWTSAALVAGCVCLEPLVRWALGRASPPDGVWLAEIAAGVGIACSFALARRRRPARP